MAKISILLRALVCLSILCGFAPVQPVGALQGGPVPDLLKDINPIASMASNPKAFMQVDGVTYFFITNADNQNELWKTDGTSQGTVLVKQGVGPGGTQGTHKWVSPPGWYNVYNGIVYFAGTNEWGLNELWRTNGTEAGTFRVLNEAGTFYFSDPKHLVLYNQYLVFTSGDYFFHRIDSNLEPPQFMFTLPSAPTSNVIYHFQKLFFIAYDTSTNLYKLFESDSTSAKVTPDSVDLELKPEQDLVFFKGNLFFSARYTGGGEPSHGFELYKLSPIFTKELVIDINPTGDSNPEVLGVAKEWIIFTADNGTGVRTLWRNNNIPGGIYQVDQFGGSSVGPHSLGALGDRLVYPADGNLWAIDGPSGNTYQLSSATVNDYLVWAAYGGKLYYSALDPALGIEVQVTDGSSAAIYKDINPGLTGSLPLAMAPCGDSLCISASDGQHGTELWMTNGNPDDVHMVADLNPRPINSNPVNITTAGDLTFFHADDGVKADSLWRTDGTPGGTIPLIQDETIIFPPYVDGDPGPLFAVGARVFFIASDPEHGRELWVSDGTSGGTRLVKDIAPGVGDPHINLLTPSAGRVFFVAHSGPAGSELMVSDGSEAGTYLVKDILGDPMFDNRSYKEIVPYGNGVAFILDNLDPRSSEVWISDGTEDGTKYVATFGNAQDLGEVGGKIFFSVQEEVDGELELYQSDGTPAGTSVVGSLGFATGYQAGVIRILGIGENVFVFVKDAGWIKLWVSRPVTGLELLHTFNWMNGVNPNLIYTATANGKLAMVIFEYDAVIDRERVHLWVSDGTVNGTLLMPGDYDFIMALRANEEGFIFNAESGTEGRQIWKSDGTPEGTEQLTHFPQAMCSTREMGLLGEAILLPLDDFEAGGTAGCELWTLTEGLWRKVYVPAVMR